MKKPILCILSLLTFAFVLPNVRAQSPVSFGMKAGLNMATFNHIDSELEMLTGYAAGGFVNLKIPAIPLSIQPGIYYSRKGAEKVDSFGGNDITTRAKFDYLEVPVLAKIEFNTPGPVKPHLLLGPYAGIILNSEAEIMNSGGSSSGDIEQQTNKIDYGASAGLGTDINIGLNILILEARYSYGFSETFNNDLNDADFENARNGVFSLMAGIRF